MSPLPARTAWPSSPKDAGDEAAFDIWTLSVPVAGVGTLVLRYAVVVGQVAPAAPASDGSVPGEPTRTGDGRVSAGFFVTTGDQSVGVERRFPLAAVVGDGTTAVAIGPHRLRSTGARGATAGGGHELTWDLRWAEAPLAVRAAPVWQLAAGLGQPHRRAVAPALKVDGSIGVDGRRHALLGAPATLDHAWGTRHATRWAVARCAAFAERPDVALEASAWRPRHGRVPAPPVTVVRLAIGDERIALDDLRHLPRNRARWDNGVFRFEATGLNLRVVGEVTSRPDQQLAVEAAAPGAGFLAHSGVADVRLQLHRRRGLTMAPAETLTATATGLLEVGQPERDRLVRRTYHRAT